MAEAEIVILSQREECDPRNEERKATVRVVLHRHASRVLVDIARGIDATGVPLPVRLDPHADDVSSDDIRVAYGSLERVVGEWYDRAIAAEHRATDAEARVRRAESRVRTGPAIPLPAADPKASAKQRVAKLLELASHAQTPEREAGAAAMAAVRLIREHSLSVK